MTVYVDSPIYHRRGVKKPRKFYAHMVADSIEELHEFARKIGVKPHFLHRGSVVHYDINQHALAVESGAKKVSSREIIDIGKVAKHTRS